MRKGFTRKPQGDEPATQGRNYITPSGLLRLRDEHRFLLTRERPAVTKVVAWAAANGDRSENADYQYGKRRLRQIDGRIRFLTKRIEAAEVVDPESPRAGQAAARAFFGGYRALYQCRRNGAGGEHRGHRRGRSQPQLHQLGVAPGARVDEVGSWRPRSSRVTGRYRIPDRPRSVLQAHFCGTVPGASWSRGLGKGTPSSTPNDLTKVNEAAISGLAVGPYIKLASTLGCSRQSLAPRVAHTSRSDVCDRSRCARGRLRPCRASRPESGGELSRGRPARVTAAGSSPLLFSHTRDRGVPSKSRA